MKTEETICALFRIDDVFLITSRGLILAGKLIEGHLLSNDYIEFKIDAELFCLRIKAINMPSQRNVEEQIFGILVECKDEAEEIRIRNCVPNGVLGIIKRLE